MIIFGFHYRNFFEGSGPNWLTNGRLEHLIKHNEEQFFLDLFYRLCDVVKNNTELRVNDLRIKLQSDWKNSEQIDVGSNHLKITSGKHKLMIEAYMMSKSSEKRFYLVVSFSSQKSLDHLLALIQLSI